MQVKTTFEIDSADILRLTAAADNLGENLKDYLEKFLREKLIGQMGVVHVQVEEIVGKTDVRDT